MAAIAFLLFMVGMGYLVWNAISPKENLYQFNKRKEQERFEESYSDLIGKTLEQANLLSSKRIRAVIIDGTAQVTTRDYRTNRINVEIKKNRIVRIIGEG